jgi:quercetin dioxygenase-like cupin family protein
MVLSNMALQPYFSQGGQGQAAWFGTTHMTVKAGSESTGSGLTAIEVLSPPGGSAPWHVHHREDEIFYVLEGSAVFKCGDELFQAGPGAFVFLPRDIPHSYKTLGEAPARWLLLTTPAGAEGFFIEAGVPAAEDGVGSQPLDPRKLGAIAAKYGLEILGPPPF